MFPCQPYPMPAPSHPCFCGCASHEPAARREFQGSVLSRLAQVGDPLWHAIDYVPDSTFLLGRVSRELHRFIGEGVNISITAIFSQCSMGNSAVYSAINRLKTRHCSLPEDAMPAHASLAKTLMAMGVIMPGHILSPAAMIQYDGEVQPAQDDSLQRIWSRLRTLILTASPELEGVPEANASAEDARAWMREPAHQSILERIPVLGLVRLGLTCVPTEIRLCTALQTLRLNGNQLTTLAPSTFEGLVALRILDLDSNQLTTLAPGIFEGLPTLRHLNLDQNQLATLAPRTFEGLTALKTLSLSQNALTTLAPGTFEGLTALQRLYIYYNQLTTLAVGSLEGLIALETIDVHHNRLPIPDPETFRGLIALRSLYIRDNRQADPDAWMAFETAARAIGAKHLCVNYGY